MTLLFARSHAAGASPVSNPMDDREALSDLFRPVVAGARARGVADAFELLGIDAVLIDATGRVLHAGRNVGRVLAPAAEIVQNHLLSRDPAVNEALQRLIAQVIDPPDSVGVPREVNFEAPGQTCGLRIRAIPYPVGEDVQSQLLKAVLIVSSGTSGAEDGRAGPR